MAELRLDRDVIEDGKLAVSETATNALRHAGPTRPDWPPTDPELWIWARTVPSPQLIVSVFDRARMSGPRASGAGLLDQHGKGLKLVAEVTAAWGSVPTRSRVNTVPVCGKAVWFALPLPRDWPGLHYRVQAATAAHHLLLNLTGRGFEGTHGTDDAAFPSCCSPTSTYGSTAAPSAGGPPRTATSAAPSSTSRRPPNSSSTTSTTPPPLPPPRDEPAPPRDEPAVSHPREASLPPQRRRLKRKIASNRQPTNSSPRGADIEKPRSRAPRHHDRSQTGAPAGAPTAMPQERVADMVVLHH